MKKISLLMVFVFNLFTFFQSSIQAQDTVWTGFYPGNIINAIFSPDDSKILVSGETTFLEVNPVNGAIIRQLPPFGAVLGLSYDKKYLITDNQKLFNVNDYSLAKDLSVNLKNFGKSISISYDNELKIFALLFARMGPAKDTIIFIDGTSLQVKKIYTDSLANEDYKEIKISPDGKYFATLSLYYGDPKISTDNGLYIRICSLETYQVINELKWIPMPPESDRWSIQFSPDSKMLAFNLENKLEIYDAPSSVLNCIVKMSQGEIFSFTFSNDSKFLYLGGNYVIDKFNIFMQKLEYTYNYIYGFLFINQSNNSGFIISGEVGKLELFKDGITSVPNPKNDTSIIFPNPTSDFLEIQFPPEQFQCKIEIFSIEGIKILESEPVQRIDVSRLMPGVYFVKLGSRVQKFVKM